MHSRLWCQRPLVARIYKKLPQNSATARLQQNHANTGIFLSTCLSVIYASPLPAGYGPVQKERSR